MPKSPAQEVSPEKLEKAAYLLRAIAHPTRLQVIGLLEAKEKMSVNELMELTGCEQSLLSHHLTGMRSKGLLRASREGKNIYYFLKEKNLSKILECIKLCDCNF